MALVGNMDRYNFEENDGPARDGDTEKEARMKRAKVRLKSLTGLKNSTNMAEMQKQERVLSRRCSVGNMALIHAPEQRRMTLKKGVNTIRAMIRFRNVLRPTRMEGAPSMMLRAGKMERESRDVPKIQSLLSQPSPGKKSGLSFAMIARLGARKTFVVQELSEADKDLNKVQKVTWASKFFRKALHKFKSAGDAKKLFYKSVRRVLVLLKWKAQLQEESKTVESEMKTFLDMAQELDETPTVNIEEKTGLAFDVRMYKADRSVKLTEDTKLTLTTPTVARTDEAVQKAQSELQMMKSFSEYPLHMQFKLAKVAWYQEVQPKRIIIKEGHYAENFYFILSGQAIVKKMVRNEETDVLTMTTLGRLKDGQCFGEIALLHHSRRTATVESATVCQLLLIGRGDFFDIFLGSQNGREPEHIAFCRGVTLLKNWPIAELNDANKSCLFNFFRRGIVVVSDSTQDDWIYIVKTGSCIVLKRLDAVTPKMTWVARAEPRSLKLPRIGTADIEAKIDSNYPISKTHKLSEGLQKAMTEFFKTQQKANNKRSAPQTTETATDRRTSVRTGNANSIGNERPTAASRTTGKAEQCAPGSRPPSRPVSGACRSNSSCSLHLRSDSRNNSADRGAPSRASWAEIDGTAKKNRLADNAPAGGHARVEDESNLGSRLAPQRPKSSRQSRPSSSVNFLPVVNVINSAQSPQKSIRPITNESSKEKVKAKEPVPKQPCFIQLKKLVPGETFGLEYITFEHDQPEETPTSVAMVSNGAELIMISKAFFLRHCNEQVRRNVRETIQRYPGNDILQNNLQTEVNWKLYKDRLVEEVVETRLSQLQ